MSTPLQEALERTSIADLYCELSGGNLRGGRGPATWRGGKSPNVAIYADSQSWHDYKTREGGNALNLVCTALNVTPGDAARWLIERAGVEDKPLTRAARLERHRAERDAEEARLFAVAANALADQCLSVDSVFDPARIDITELIGDIKRNALEVFRSYRRDHPQLARGLVIAGRLELERREIAAARELRKESTYAA